MSPGSGDMMGGRVSFWGLVLLAACGGETSGGLGRADAGAGTEDAGGQDGGVEPDSGFPDAGPADFGGPDAGIEPDGGPLPCGPEVGPAPGRVRTTLGVVEGVQADGVWSYLGLRYAQPPVGERRWTPPAEPECAPTVVQADAPRPECPQYDGAGQVVGDEDCLGLNLWTPVGEADGGSRPVLVWVHGGGHEQGGGGRAIYEGAQLARSQDVVVVTFNYRLGPFGFLAHPVLDAPGVPSGNYGMHDQLAVLRWVQANARAFGGDPDRVMIFGQSAGGVSVCRLVASPAAAGLFASAVIQSGACVATSKAQADATGADLLAEVGCDDAVCLREASTEAIMAGFEPSASGTNVVGRLTFDGVVDGVLLPEAPRELIERGDHNAVPIAVGSTREENGLGAPSLQNEAAYEAAVRALYGGAGVPDALIDRILEIYPASDYPNPRAAYVALTSDLRFTCQARQDAQLLAGAQEAPVYRYLFTHVPDEATPLLQAAGAWHGLELFYVFGTLESASTLSAGPGDRATTQAMQTAWSRLARGLAPDPTPEQAWPEWDGDENLVIFEGGARVEPDPKAQLCSALFALGGG